MIYILILLILVACLPVWGTRDTGSHLTEYIEPSLSLTTYQRKVFDENILVTTADGQIHLFSSNGDKVWSTEVAGGALVSSFHPVRDDSEVYPARVDSVGIMIPSVKGSVLSYIGGELRAMGISVSDLVDQTPKLASDGTLFLGSKQSNVFGIDIKDGRLVDMGEEGSVKERVVWFARVDYLVRSVERGSGTEMWNFTFSQLEPLSGMSDIVHKHNQVERDLPEEFEKECDEYEVNELQICTDGTFSKFNRRGDQSQNFKLGLTSPIASAFVTTPIHIKPPTRSESGVLLLPKDDQDDDLTGDLVVGRTEVKELHINHHLSSSTSSIGPPSKRKRASMDHHSMALVAQVESSQFNDYSSLFAVEYLANRQDVDASYTALTAPTKQCCWLEQLKSSALPRLPVKLVGSRKDISSVITKSKSNINTPGKLNQSALSLVNVRIPGGKKSANEEVHCHKGSPSFPECIIGLHLLDVKESNDGVVDVYNNHSYVTLDYAHKSHKHENFDNDKKFQPHSIHIMLTVLLLFCVSWLKENKMLPYILSFFQSFIGFLGRFLIDVMKPGSALETIDSEGNMTVGNLKVTKEKLGHGSMGTIVFRGALDGRPVAVKRMLCDYHAAATREIKLLIESDGHPNVVRYFLQESSGSFVYLALELCAMSLHEAMEQVARKSSCDSRGKSSRVLEPPSPIVCSAMLDIVKGVAFLHKQHIVHRDIKPHNILLAPRRSFSSKYKSWQQVRESLHTMEDLSLFTLKISDMGLGKLLTPGGSSESVGGRVGDCSGGGGYSSGSVHGTVGWQAPEVVVGSSNSSPMHQTCRGDWTKASSADIFSLGCVLYHVINPGAHLYGEEWFEREANIVNNRRVGLDNLSSSPTALCLVENMTCKYLEDRPSAKTVEEHLMFWPPLKKLNFLVELSDKLELEQPTSSLLLSIETCATEVVGEEGWSRRIDTRLMDDLSKYRKYDVASVRALLRVIRNKRHHWHELSQEVQDLIKPFPEGLGCYFEIKFPKLIHHCYETTREFLSSDTSFNQYFTKGSMLPTKQLSVSLPKASSILDLDQGLTDNGVAAEESLKNEQEQCLDPCPNLDKVVVFRSTDISEALQCRGWSRPLSHWQQGLDRQTLTGSKHSLPPALQRCAQDGKFRTRLCQHWDSSLGCKCPLKNKGKCDFAHGPIELRVKESKLNRWGLKQEPLSSTSLYDSNVPVLYETVDDEERNREELRKGLSGGEDTYGAARNVEKIRKDDGKDEVEKRKRNQASFRGKGQQRDRIKK